MGKQNTLETLSFASNTRNQPKPHVLKYCTITIPRNIRGGGGGGGGGSSVGRARDSWSGGPGFDSRCGRPLPTGWVGVSIM